MYNSLHHTLHVTACMIYKRHSGITKLPYGLTTSTRTHSLISTSLFDVASRKCMTGVQRCFLPLRLLAWLVLPSIFLPLTLTLSLHLRLRRLVLQLRPQQAK